VGEGVGGWAIGEGGWEESRLGGVGGVGGGGRGEGGRGGWFKGVG